MADVIIGRLIPTKKRSPHEYWVHYGLKKARELLLQGSDIAGAAYDAGFVDQSHFSRSFKRFIGVMPGEYVYVVKERLKVKRSKILK
jgi:AraC-like DNA-binding protein